MKGDSCAIKYSYYYWLIMAILFGILVIFVLIVCILSMVYKIIDILNH